MNSERGPEDLKLRPVVRNLCKIFSFLVIRELEHHQQDKDKSQCSILWGRRMVNFLLGKVNFQKLMAVAKTVLRVSLKV